jgi:hypothetical protein
MKGKYMNEPISTVTGTVLRVQFDGQGINSGDFSISLDNGLAYWVFMDTPPEFFVKIFKIAVTAMWEVRKVEIRYVLRVSDSNKGVVSIRKL